MWLLDSKPSSHAQRIWKYILSIVAFLIIIWIAARFVSIIVAWSFYSQFFQKIREVGGLPDFISGAIAIWCVVATMLLIPAITLSIFVKQRRKVIFIAAGALSLWMVFLYGLSVQQSKNYFNPMTGTPNYKYSRDANGKIKLFVKDYSFDPETGRKLETLTSEALQDYETQKANEQALKEQLLKDQLVATQKAQEIQEELQLKKARQEEAANNLEQKTPEVKAAGDLDRSLTTQAPPPFRPQPPQPPAIVASGKSNDFLIDVHPCSRDGRSVRCTISITNLSGFERWELFQPGSYLLDDLGNKYFSSNIGGPGTYPSKHAVNVFFVFKDVAESAQSCSLTFKHHGTGDYQERQIITFDKIPIQ